MRKLPLRSRTLLGTVVAAAVLVLPASALADCTTVAVKSAFKGPVKEWYPKACYTAAIKKLGPDANTYSPNVARNLKAAMRRDTARKLKFTIQWLPKGRVRVISNYPAKSALQLRKGAKLLKAGSLSSKTAILKTPRTRGALKVVLVWKLGKKSILVTGPAPLAKVVKKKR